VGLRLLCVVAHPDDECFGFGGALALAADQGVETFVLCLTDGQAATNRGESHSAEELGRMRRAEFAASCEVLGVSRHELLDYQDGQLEFVDFSQAAGRLVAIMREYKPDVVITFGNDGGLNTHADHTMVSTLTCAAFHWAASAKRYPEAGPVHHAEKLYLLTTSYFMEGRPAPMPAPWTIALDIRTVMARKQRAFAAHTSQAPLMEKTKAMFEEFGHTEHYLLAAVREPRGAALETGMFEGLEAN
jgi:LmbE family N-acetylglucosaminyl deacetylase